MDTPQERRRFPRIKASVPVEVHSAENVASLRAATHEISLSGCYIEMMFTMQVGTKVGLVFWLDEDKVSATAVIATRYPQVGNGIGFTEIAPEDRAKLSHFLFKHARERPT
jgi:c-di-GMP-binding flagellar brake protein YcgR